MSRVKKSTKKKHIFTTRKYYNDPTPKKWKKINQRNDNKIDGQESMQ